LEILLKDLLNKEENLWLEFKSYWYWNEGDTELQKPWSEFFKDFVAIFNTYTENKDKKYMILGFDDKSKEIQNYDLDKHGNNIKFLEDTIELKKQIIKRLKKLFRNVPDYKLSDSLKDIEDFFYLNIVEYDNKKVLMIIFHEAPYLLELKNILIGNESFKEGNIIIRKLKKDNTPENTVADILTSQKILNTVSEIKETHFPEKTISIKKIVEVFKEINIPSSIIKHTQNDNSLSSGLNFELYTLESKYGTNIDFIYFSKHTVQSKSIDYIKEKKLLDPKSKKFLLVDEFNKNGGKIDKKGIEKLINDVYTSENEINYIEEFALEHLYKDLFSPDIFHDGNFGISDFIKPFTSTSSEKTADLLLKEWFKSDNEPLLVIKGMGGIGKTTVIKFFLDNLYKEYKNKNLNILFINSHEIIDDIMKNKEINDLYDFYNTIADINQITERFNKKLLQLSIDNGNMIIVLDGLDEVIAKMGSKFNVSNFIKSIYDDYSENLAKTKIIITCRDYFWDKQQFSNIQTMSLNPFNEEMAKKYFKQFFDNDKRILEALGIAKKFVLDSNDKDQVSYVPYVLDMIKENAFDDSKEELILDTEYLIPDIILNDYIIAKACEREMFKLDALTIDKQIDIFIDMSLKYNGALHKNNFKDLYYQFNDQESFIEKFNAHPLLSYKHDTLKFRYDFFNEYFKNIKIVELLKSNNFTDMSNNLIETIIQHISIDGSLALDIKKRLSNKIDIGNFKFAVLTFIAEEINNLQIKNEIKEKLSSSLFTLIMLICNPKDINERTELLKDIFEITENQINNLNLINLHSINNKITFNFNDLKFKNCKFENFESFSECKFNNNTYFDNCQFYPLLHKENSSSTIKWDNINTQNCEVEGIVDILNKNKNQQNQKDSDLRKSLKEIFKCFWSGSSFKIKREEDLNKKISKYNQLVKLLEKESIIIMDQKTTKEKRNDKVMYINNNYSNLRKIMEENNTCTVFESLIKKIKSLID
jgi:hypothetical protein